MTEWNIRIGVKTHVWQSRTEKISPISDAGSAANRELYKRIHPLFCKGAILIASPVLIFDIEIEFPQHIWSFATI